MKRLALAILSSAAVAAATVGIAAPSASAIVNTCSAAAVPGCATLFGGYQTYNESRSSKSGAAAASICTYLIGYAGTVAGSCANESTFIRVCSGTGVPVYGSHTGSSSAWIVDGRDATPSDATTCV